MEADGKKDQAQQLKKQGQRLYERMAEARGDAPKNDGEESQEEANTLIESEGPALVRQAYLRTLSRNPDEHELTSSLAYLRDSDTVAEGLRDLVWALVNTKEFMVNH